LLLLAEHDALYRITGSTAPGETLFSCERLTFEDARVSVAERRENAAGADVRTRVWTFLLAGETSATITGEEIVNSSGGPDAAERLARAVAVRVGWPL
jgi:hypothetical protein